MIRVAASVAGLLLTLGCSGSPGPDPTVESSRGRVETLLGHYLQYSASHKQTAPPNEPAFRAFLVGKGVADVDTLLTSPRDGQPFVITFNQSLAPDPSKGNLPPELREKVAVIREATGANGKRMVGYSSGLVEEVAASAPLN